MLYWESVKAEFVWEGSWRDICVQEVSQTEWQAAVDALRASGFDQNYTVDGIRSEMPQDLSEVLKRTDETSLLLWVLVAGVQLNCHFFDESEIEFDLDPREVTGQPQLAGVIKVMQILAAATGRFAIMTPENMHEAPFIRVSPSGEIEYISSGGFFEELARGRS
jgi:hypothetical protein